MNVIVRTEYRLPRGAGQPEDVVSRWPEATKLAHETSAEWVKVFEDGKLARTWTPKQTTIPELPSALDPTVKIPAHTAVMWVGVNA